MTNARLRQNIKQYISTRDYHTRGVQHEFTERLRVQHYRDLVELFSDTLMQAPSVMQLGIIAQTKDDNVRDLMIRISLRHAMQQLGFNEDACPEV